MCVINVTIGIITTCKVKRYIYIKKYQERDNSIQTNQ